MTDETGHSAGDTDRSCPECGRKNVLRDGDQVWCIDHGWNLNVDTEDSS